MPDDKTDIRTRITDRIVAMLESANPTKAEPLWVTLGGATGLTMNARRGDADAGEAQPDTQPVPPEKLQPILQNIFHANVGSVAPNSQHFTQTAQLGISAEDHPAQVPEQSLRALESAKMLASV
jgi:hypothetical protein